MHLKNPTKKKCNTIEVHMPCHLGLHMRTAAKFIGFSKKFESQIEIQCRKFSANGKSIMGLLCLGVSKNERLMITVCGDDADIACCEIEKYFQQKDNCYDER
jgi:phosphocarrier protein